MFKRHFSEFLRTKSRLLGTILEFAAWTKPSHLFSSVAHILFTLLQSHQPPTASLQSSFSPHDICTLSISSWGASFQTSLLPSSSLLSGLYRGLPQVKLVWSFSTSHGFPVIPLSFLLSFFPLFLFLSFFFPLPPSLLSPCTTLSSHIFVEHLFFVFLYIASSRSLGTQVALFPLWCWEPWTVPSKKQTNNQANKNTGWINERGSSSPFLEAVRWSSQVGLPNSVFSALILSHSGTVVLFPGHLLIFILNIIVRFCA